MTKSQFISLQVRKDDTPFQDAVRDAQGVDAIELETSSFDGQSEIITLVVTVTPLVIGLIGRIVCEQIRARRYVNVVYKGVQIQGLSDENATRLIEALLEKEP